MFSLSLMLSLDDVHSPRDPCSAIRMTLPPLRAKLMNDGRVHGSESCRGGTPKSTTLQVRSPSRIIAIFTSSCGPLLSLARIVLG